MSLAPKQKKLSNELDQPKISARTRFQQSFISTINHQNKQKSVNKSSSIKYLKEISPKRSKSNTKLISNNILKLLDRYEQTLNDSDGQNLPFSERLGNFQSYPSNYSKIGEALKTIDINQQTNRQTTRLNHQKNHSQNRMSIKQNMLQKFQFNEAKIIVMRQNLQKIFTTYKGREKQIAQMKQSLKNRGKIKSQNEFLSKQISRVQLMIKEALLERQKLKFGPFSQLTKRNKK